MGLVDQLVWLVILAIPVASISWTVTREEVFREPREWCLRRSQRCRRMAQRKFYYLFTCEYCFSHYVALGVLAVTRFRLLFNDWRGYAVAWFSLVWLANLYMSGFGRMRVEIKQERVDTAMREQQLHQQEQPRIRAAR